MNADEMIEVIQAWKNGKEIEFLWHNHEDYEDWELTTDPEWNFPEVDYRIKPAEIAAGRNPEKLTVDQIKGYRCLSEEEFEALEEGSEQSGIYFLSQASTIYEVANYFNRYEYITYFTDKPEGYFLPKQEPEKPYWSKPEDVPMDAEWIRKNSWADGVRAKIIKIDRLGIVYAKDKLTGDSLNAVRIPYGGLSGYEVYNGSEWKECRCESI